jgi:hypothetical protein
MGTRADFYVGVGSEAEWLGSIAWDGDPEGIPPSIKRARGDADYRAAVERFLGARDDATKPADGWPWPWDDSALTDYAYAFTTDGVAASRFGTQWFDPDKPQPELENAPKTAVFPNMAARKRVTFGKRSGAIFIQGAP